jgi:hypothetical protein
MNNRNTCSLTLLAISLMGLPQSTWSQQSSFGSALGPVKNGIFHLSPYFRIDISRLWPSLNIPVCWEQSASGFSAEKSFVESAVESNIESNSEFRFGDKPWRTCAMTDTNGIIRINVLDGGPNSLVGYQATQTTFGGAVATPVYMNLNFEFNNWSPACKAVNPPNSKRENCIRTIGVHEFLHAIGALHEQLSPDIKTKDPKCYALYKDKPDVFGTKPFEVTTYDADSIMNYCRNIYSEPTRLSKLDLDGILILSNLVKSIKK